VLLALSYVAVGAVTLAVMLTCRTFDPRSTTENPWLSALGAISGTVGGLGAWHFGGTLFWAAVLAGAALFSWSLGRWRRRIAEIPKYPLGL
jgi:uncharacterized membrane protein